MSDTDAINRVSTANIAPVFPGAEGLALSGVEGMPNTASPSSGSGIFSFKLT